MSETIQTDDAPVDSQAILKKFDKESDYRVYSGFFAKFVAALAITFSVFQLYTAVFGVLDAMIQRSIHLSFGLCLIFLLYPTSKKWSRTKLHPLDAVLAVLGVLAPIYIVANYQVLVTRAGQTTPFDLIAGIIGILLVLEAARRVVGIPMVIVALVFVTYAFIGPYIPGKLAHRGARVDTLVQHLYYTTEGIFGIPLGVSSTFIFLFILFGAYLERTGLGQLFIDLSNAVAGWTAGGPAKVAVLSSALMGTVSGSSVANVVGTGSFTIPMMKKLGYKGEFAGAVEATASTGGQLMPPIMGAAAFLMAEFTGLPYSRIIAGAAIPALLYYFGVWSGVHYEAKKLGLKGLSREDLPKFKRIMLDRGHLIIPLVAIIYLLVTGFTPMKAALWAIILSILSSMVRKATRIKPMEIIKGLEAGARGALGVIAATACAGIIIGVVTLTGLGLKLGSVLVEIANGNLLITLFFTMLTSILLGMGVPTTANYVITSTIAAPAIVMIMAQRAGLDPFAVAPAHIILPAHMFAFYFGIIADVTPPVALAAFAGAGIAKANPMKTGVNATKLAIAAFLVPYIFVMSPQMLLFNVTPIGLIWMLITSLIGITAVSGAVNAWFRTHMNWIERIAAFAGGLLMIYPGLVTDSIGLGLCGAVFISQQIKYKKKTLAS
ncbi:MAG: TRAP transporter permease [Spirochaetia bacterium]|jgi:TRAP transporter 4TM/12TM fusion protein|nr:TRAP transporter permease [Spirochaetia bacterium]MCE1210054.1 TRAP transporter permease [Spirochaetia bacterium]MDD3819962.1 TRAP transporter permease [Spirochaetales bacterium]NLX45150.1 TRAP transporter permease [Treponema sp.]HOI22156.1 TRAP transporter permease [Spirochaetales bacterium]